MRVRHEFVEFMPEDTELEPGVLYISLRYRVTAHLCPCGCKSAINASLSPVRWSLRFDGETVSMWPSFGNWSLPCRSHYWISQGRIRWARQYSEEEIRETQQADLEDLVTHYGEDE